MRGLPAVAVWGELLYGGVCCRSHGFGVASRWGTCRTVLRVGVFVLRVGCCCDTVWVYVGHDSAFWLVAEYFVFVVVLRDWIFEASDYVSLALR